jgi:hypothetical protein
MESLVEEIQAHLDQVSQEPSLPLDRTLLGTLDHGLSDALQKEQVIGLITQIAALLPTIQQDPLPVTSLAEVLADSSSFTFADVLLIQPPIPFVEGLSPQVPPVNIVTLSLLEKAGNSPTDAGMLASKFDVIKALINLWLRTESMGVATKAYNVFALLLKTGDKRESETAPLASDTASNLMWRRITTDKDVYNLFFSLPSFKTLGQSGQPNKKLKTIAQARLLEFVKDFCHMEELQKSHIPEIEQAFGVFDGGLMDFAMVHMVDYKDDLLMHVSLVEFFGGYLSQYHEVSTPNNNTPTSKGLDFLTSRGLHERTVNYVLKPEEQDSLELSLIYPAATRYLAIYASTHEQHFLRAQTMKQILDRLSDRIRTISTNELANDRAPKEELYLLAHIPRLALLPSPERDSLVFLLPIRPANVDVLITLSKLFRGGAAARVLFLQYLGRHPNLFGDLVTIASLVAVKNTAKAALNLIHTLIETAWTSQNEEELAHLPSEPQLQSQCRVYGSTPLPKNGMSALLLPPAISTVIPYLLKGAENASEEAYEVANAKFEVLRSFANQLEKMIGGATDAEDAQTLLVVIRRRISQGPIGSRDSEDGGLPARLSIATVSR